jgi:hypothetical protein
VEGADVHWNFGDALTGNRAWMRVETVEGLRHNHDAPHRHRPGPDLLEEIRTFAAANPHQRPTSIVSLFATVTLPLESTQQDADTVSVPSSITLSIKRCCWLFSKQAETLRPPRHCDSAASCCVRSASSCGLLQRCVPLRERLPVYLSHFFCTAS